MFFGSRWMEELLDCLRASWLEDEEYGKVQEEEEDGLGDLSLGSVILSYTGATATLLSVTCK